MKNMNLVLASAFALVASIASVQAADSKPCKTIKAACEAAGFVKGGHKTGKGLFKDCMKPIMAGTTVPGVTVPADEVQACQAKKAKRASKKTST